jgi:Sulfotransferase family
MHTFQRNTLPSEAYLEIKLAVLARWDRFQARMQRAHLAERFRDVEVFCIFIGYPRSGHSVVGSLIDAHPDAIAAHRLNSLKYIELGDPFEQILQMALLNAMRFDRDGRKLTAYSYAIDGLWQGRYRRLRVVCDQEGERNVLAIGRNPALIDRLRSRTRCDVRFIHVVRNCYDNITTMAIRSLQKLEPASQRYFALCDLVAAAKKQLPPESVLDISHEDLIARPDREIGRFAGFLGLPLDDEYVARCKTVLHPSPHRSRDEVAWREELIDSVSRRAAAYPWLAGYRYREGDSQA